MDGTTLKTAGAVAVLFLIGAAPAPARADSEFGFSVGSELSAINIVGGASFSNLGTRIGVKSGRVMPHLTVDYVRVEANEDFNSQNFESTGTTVGLVTVGLGGRVWLQLPEPRHVAPYVTGGGFTIVPHADTTDDTDVPGDGSSWGLLAGFGADYWVSEEFAVGGELGGSAFFASLSTSDSTISGSIVQMYTAIELSYFPWAEEGN